MTESIDIFPDTWFLYIIDDNIVGAFTSMPEVKHVPAAFLLDITNDKIKWCNMLENIRFHSMANNKALEYILVKYGVKF